MAPSDFSYCLSIATLAAQKAKSSVGPKFDDFIYQIIREQAGAKDKILDITTAQKIAQNIKRYNEQEQALLAALKDKLKAAPLDKKIESFPDLFDANDHVEVFPYMMKRHFKNQMVRNAKEFNVRLIEAKNQKIVLDRLNYKDTVEQLNKITLSNDINVQINAVRTNASDDASIAFIKKHQNKINTLFGLCASTNTTTMFTQEILMKHLTLSLSSTTPVFYLLLIAITFNLIMDYVIFDQLEKRVDKRFLSLNYRENIKFALLTINAIVLISLGYYVIPIALLLFTASYFINYTLQMDKLGDTFIKLFLTKDASGKRKIFAGFNLSNEHLNVLKIGSVFSLIYVLTVIAVFGKWVIPLLTDVVLFGSGMMSPLGFLLGAILVIYGISYGLLAVRGWADLMQLDADLRMQHKFENGLFSLQAVGLYFNKIGEGFVNYWQDAGKSFDKFCDDIAKQAWWDVGGAILGAFAEFGLLCLKMLQIVFSIVILPAMYNLLSVGGSELSKFFIDSKQIGVYFTAGAFAGNTAFAMQSAMKVSLPEKKSNTSGAWNKFNEWRMRMFCQLPNAMASGFLANDGGSPGFPDDQSKETHKEFWPQVGTIGGVAAISCAAGGYAINNAMKNNAASEYRTQYSTLFNQWSTKKATGSTSKALAEELSNLKKSFQL